MPPHAHSGVVFTPPELARRLIEALPVADSTPVLDPAMGAGALLLAALESCPGREVHGIEIDGAHFAEAREQVESRAMRTRAHLRQDDALACSWPQGTAILANPPWLSFSGRHAESGPVRERVADSAELPGGWPSLQSAFCARIAEHVARERTAAALLLPASLTELDGYAAVRERVTSLCRLSHPPIELGESAFPGVIGSAVLVVLEAHLEARRGDATAWTRTTAAEAEFLDELRTKPRLGRDAFADPGVHTGNSSKLLVTPSPAPKSRPLRRGKDLAPFALGTPSLWLRTDVDRTADRRFRIAALEHYAGFPVLLRQTADRPLAALHETPTYFRNSLLGMRHQTDLDPAFAVAVLNGSVAGAWHRLAHRDARQRSFPQVKVSHLREQPFPIRRRADAPDLHDEVCRRVQRLDPRADDFEVERSALDEIVLDAFDLSASSRELARSYGGIAPLRFEP